jgi:hypothetical protein
LSFNFNHFDICLDPVAVLSDTQTVMYLNPSFEVAYNFSNKLITQSKPAFSEILSFQGEKIENLKDGMYYNLQFSTSKGQTGGAQVAVLKRDNVYIVYMRDLEFEDRLQSKYKALIGNLRDYNKKLTRSLDDGYEQLYEHREFLSILDFEPSFCLLKANEDFKILDFTYKGMESEFGVKLKGLNILNMITKGKAEDLIFFQNVLRSRSFKIDKIPFPIVSVEFIFSGRPWKGSFYALRDLNLNLHYYFVLKDTILRNETLDIQQPEKNSNDQDWAMELLKSYKDHIISDFTATKTTNSKALFRNYFWQKLILKLRPEFMENFLKTHLVKAAWGVTYKVLTLKNLDLSLSQNLEISGKAQLEEFSNLSLKNQIQIYEELIDINPAIRIKTREGLANEDLFSALGCLLYFLDFTKLEINTVTIKQLEENIEIKIQYAEPRDIHLAYDFLKKSGLKGFEMGKDFLRIYI